MSDLMLLAISYAYIFLVIFVSFLVERKTKDKEKSRKLIHILVGSWVFISPFFENILLALFVPFTFIFINFISVKYNFISSMNRESEENNYGTVYYAISIFILTFLGHIFNMWTMPIIGVLTMAYGDGFAAIFGKKYGNRKISFNKSKTFIGSLTVFIFTFLISLISSIIFKTININESLSVLGVLIVAFLSGFLASFVEAIGKNGYDNLTLPISIGIFSTLLIYFYSIGQLIAILFAALLLYYAYMKGSIALNATVLALLTGQSLYVFGGIYLYLSLISFFILSSIVSTFKNEEKKKSGEARNWIQVFCNSFPALLTVWIVYYTGKIELLLISYGAFAAANADTFSSEIGSLSKGKVFNILNGKELPKGLSGGVTLLGLVSGIIGSLLISLLAIGNFGLNGFFVSFLIGIVGTLFDSVIGILFQKKYKSKEGVLQDYPEEIGDKPVGGLSFVTNNTVNLLTISIVPLLALLFI